jgi:hypothetical protein
MISLVVLDGIANLFPIQDKNRPNPWHHQSTTFCNWAMLAKCSPWPLKYHFIFCICLGPVLLAFIWFENLETVAMVKKRI